MWILCMSTYIHMIYCGWQVCPLEFWICLSMSILVYLVIDQMKGKKNNIQNTISVPSRCISFELLFYIYFSDSIPVLSCLDSFHAGGSLLLGVPVHTLCQLTYSIRLTCLERISLLFQSLEADRCGFFENCGNDTLYPIHAIITWTKSTANFGFFTRRLFLISALPKRAAIITDSW